MPSHSEREVGVPQRVLDALRRRRRLRPLWYVGPLEAKTEPCPFCGADDCFGNECLDD